MNTRLLLLLALPFSLIGCGDSADLSSGDQKGAVSFASDIKPLLDSRSVNCPNTRTLPGQLNPEPKRLAFTPGPAGPFIVPGDPDASRLYTFTLKKQPDPKAMPPTKHVLSAAEKKLLHDWIAEGASWPDGKEGFLRVLEEPAS